jgi:cyclase
MEQITKNVYATTDIMGCNPGYVTTSNGVVVIDTPQLPTRAGKMREDILKKGPIRFLVNTEHHVDHILGNLFFAELCPVIGHELFLESWGTAFAGQDLYTFVEGPIRKNDPDGLGMIPSGKDLIIEPPTITFTGRLTFRVGDHVFELFNTPGHTKGQIAVYIPQEKVLFTGDTIFCECQTWFRSADPDEWLASLNFLYTLDFDYLIPGHGPICDKKYILKQSAVIREWVTAVAIGIAKGWNRRECTERINFLDRFPMDIGLDDFGPTVHRMNVEQIFDFLQGKRKKSN